VVYVAPPADELPLSMKDFYAAAEDIHESEVVKHAGRMLLRLLKIHPFTQGNGRIARWVATYMLRRAGYHERPLRTMEKYIDEHLDEYYEALALSSNEAPRLWDVYFSDAVGEVFASSGNGKARELLALLRRTPKEPRR
jgi:Fic family protein